MGAACEKRGGSAAAEAKAALLPVESTSPAPMPAASAPKACGPGSSVASTGENRLVSAGEELIRKLKDPATDPQELSHIASKAIAKKEFAGILAARDEKGRSPLHVAATRGDLGLCRSMMAADPGIVNALDKQRNTPIMEAALYGRAMIVKALIENSAEITLKNADCMSALQLAVVNEGSGNGEVVEAIIKAGADPNDMCWQTTPLMAAADSGHSWALQTLVDMGADPCFINASGFSALDYPRDIETAEWLYDLMQGDKLSDKAAPRFDTQKMFKDADQRRARLHRAHREIALEDAFLALEAPTEWLPAFRASGENFNELRKKWRRVVFQCHPDKQPEGLEEDAAAEWTAKFQIAVAAFDAIERHYRSVCKEEELLPDVVQEES